MVLSRLATAASVLMVGNFIWFLLAHFGILVWPADDYLEFASIYTVVAMALLIITAIKYGNRDRQYRKFLNTRTVIYRKLHEVVGGMLAEAQATDDATRRESLLGKVIAIWSVDAGTDWPEVGIWPQGQYTDISPKLIREIARLANITDMATAGSVPWKKDIASKLAALNWAATEQPNTPDRPAD